MIKTDNRILTTLNYFNEIIIELFDISTKNNEIFTIIEDFNENFYVGYKINKKSSAPVYLIVGYEGIDIGIGNISELFYFNIKDLKNKELNTIKTIRTLFLSKIVIDRYATKLNIVYFLDVKSKQIILKKSIHSSFFPIWYIKKYTMIILVEYEPIFSASTAP